MTPEELQLAELQLIVSTINAQHYWFRIELECGQFHDYYSIHDEHRGLNLVILDKDHIEVTLQDSCRAMMSRIPTTWPFPNGFMLEDFECPWTLPINGRLGESEFHISSAEVTFTGYVYGPLDEPDEVSTSFDLVADGTLRIIGDGESLCSYELEVYE